MKFIVEFGKFTEARSLTYIAEECSFYMEPIENEIDFELILNKISLSVVENKVIQLSGFCGLDKSMKSRYQVPVYRSGCLKVQHNLNYGFAYGINDKDFPVYVNTQTGWICVGDPEKQECAVEFINNCVAVIDDNTNFIALWLKPETLPDI